MARTSLTPPDGTDPIGTVLAHLSDVHLPLSGPVSFRAVLNKRLASLLSWHTKRRHQHRAEVLARLVADLQEHAPDAIAVTGDLTNLGLESEYRAARGWLDALGAPGQVIVIPGNHDALVPGAWPLGAAQWAPYWHGDATPEGADVSGAFPTLRRRGPLALIGVSSAVASPFGMAVGQVDRAQLIRLADMLRDARAAGLCRVLIIHHPPLEGTVQARKRLRDAAAFRDVVQAEGVEMVLHGHSHRSHHQSLRTRDGDAPVIGVPSASSMHHEAAAYHLYRFVPSAQGWDMTLTARCLTPEGKVETGHRAKVMLARAHAR